MTAQWWFNALIYVTMPGAVAYPLLYGLRSPWWESHIGRALLIKAIGVAILLGFSVLYNLFGPNYWVRDFVRITGMVVVGIGIYYALYALILAQHEAPRRRRSTRNR